MEKYCTITDAAKRLERSRPTVYKMIADGKLRVERIAGRPFIRISDVQKWIMPVKHPDDPPKRIN